MTCFDFPSVMTDVDEDKGYNYCDEATKYCEELLDFPGWADAIYWWARILIVAIITGIIIVAVTIIIC